MNATVLVDVYRWKDDPADPNSPTLEAGRGDTIDVSDAEFQRAQDMTPPGLAKGDSAADDEFANTPVEIPKDLLEKPKKDLQALAGQLGLDTQGLDTKDALIGVILGAPGYERPQV